MFNWEERFQYMASLIEGHEVDIVAFQEVRFSIDEANEVKISQLQKAKQHLPNHKWMVAQPAGPVELPKNANWKRWTEEGLGILSKFPIISFTKIKLTSQGGRDSNPRIALHAQIQVTQSPHHVLNVVAVHFSYDKQQQCQNAQQLLEFLESQDLQNIIVLGDFNTYPDFSGPVDVFTSNVVKSCPFRRPHVPLFYDAAMDSHRVEDPLPLSFSNMPSPGYISRPDRILLSPTFKVIRSDLYGHGGPYINSCYSAIIMKRTMSMLRSAFDSFIRRNGYSCLHDCGPHGSCRCGICVRGDCIADFSVKSAVIT
ncbi:endonuclease exonuclease phosphatase [Elysia marginata]|uniref:Endonuclease exonuclease phosphatase n=1 Tax=Elysia marginata TaxID=1093978 RepID=A0AAV4J8B4_9GAST|nr:endonuclease exonuclease phosphatase [Elysia marginata]